MRARSAPTSVDSGSSASNVMDVECSVGESGWGRFAADDDEHVHMTSFTLRGVRASS